jgi:hypothetical protein
MSKSVTVIGGNVWTQRSVTWNRNVASGNVDEHPEDSHAHRRHHHQHHENEGDVPDDAPVDEWDTIQEGRTFTRRVKTS